MANIDIQYYWKNWKKIQTLRATTPYPTQLLSASICKYCIFQLSLVPNWWMLLHFGHKSSLDVLTPTNVVPNGDYTWVGNWWKENMWTLHWHLLHSLTSNRAYFLIYHSQCPVDLKQSSNFPVFTTSFNSYFHIKPYKTYMVCPVSALLVLVYETPR